MIRILLLAVAVSGAAVAQESPRAVTFEQAEGKLNIQVGGQPFATYVYQDEKIPRPYFCDLYAPNGVKVTRNHPPVEGKDLTDHDTYHPGLWLAFGDVSGADFWRNKARVRHLEFVEEPKGDSFTVKNSYETDGKEICVEECRYTVVPREDGTLLLWSSVFWMPGAQFVFGDQEEMGLGVRMATELTVEKGSGRILNSEGLKNEDGAWGKQAAWCDFSGTLDGKEAGVMLMVYPKALRDALLQHRCFVVTETGGAVQEAAVPQDLGPAWFHARDYGLLVANQFGRNAFAEGPKVRLVVPEDGGLRLHYGVYVHNGSPRLAGAFMPVHEEYLKLAEQSLPETGDKLPHGRYIDDKLIPEDTRVTPEGMRVNPGKLELNLPPELMPKDQGPN